MLSGLLREMNELLDDAEILGGLKVVYMFCSCLLGPDSIEQSSVLLRTSKKQRRKGNRQ